MQLHQLASNDFIKVIEREEIEHAIDQDELGVLPGAPDGRKPPGLPPNFKQYEAKHASPLLEKIDNLVGWSQYTYKPKYTGSQKDRNYV